MERLRGADRPCGSSEPDRINDRSLGVSDPVRLATVEHRLLFWGPLLPLQGLALDEILRHPINGGLNPLETLRAGLPVALRTRATGVISELADVRELGVALRTPTADSRNHGAPTIRFTRTGSPAVGAGDRSEPARSRARPRVPLRSRASPARPRGRFPVRTNTRA